MLVLVFSRTTALGLEIPSWISAALEKVPLSRNVRQKCWEGWQRA